MALTYWAEDHAGNEEEHKEVAFTAASTFRWAVERVCFNQWMREPDRFPPAFKDQIIPLEFVEAVAGFAPDEVRYQFSGPVTLAYAGHNWVEIGQAMRNADEQRWHLSWDTQAAGIRNGWYSDQSRITPVKAWSILGPGCKWRTSLFYS